MNDEKSLYAKKIPLGGESPVAVMNAFIEAVAQGRGVSASEVRSGMGEGRVLGADAALAAGMVDGIATFDDVLAKMQKSAISQKPPGASRLGQARAALALV